ncbi:MAG: fructosamine kinase family protein [Nocardioidaceae bacterium]|nr:fructosamine kinase family protein [Nocardioidaceae bacterium]
MARMGGVATRAEQLLGVSVVATTPVAGGDICTSTRLRLSDGRSALIKTRPHAPKDLFVREAEGLTWLAEAGGAPVPPVLGVSQECLVLAWVEHGRAGGDAAERFGRALASTHASGSETFGAPIDAYIGLAPLPNTSAATWTEFFVSRRVMPYVKAAHDRGSLTGDEARVIEQLMHRIEEFAGPPEPPSRVHGDLWSGNLIWGHDDAVHLIDPAAHGGHRETDLAMLTLFGTPHLQRILDAYDESAPLAEGWQARAPLHQLHPLLVHALMFGSGYGVRAAAAAQAVLDGTAGRDS